MKSNEFTIARQFAQMKLQCVDLGARAGAPEHLRPFTPYLAIDAFEPDEDADDRGYREMGNTTWFPIGLAAVTGTQPFYLTNQPSGSSLYPPNDVILSQFTRSRYWTVKEILNLQFYTFSDFIRKFDRPLPELIKMDTQGSELDILKSLDDEHWQSLLCVETEVEFEELYLGQPLFRDIDAFMSAKGFKLFDLRTHRAYLMKDDDKDHYLRKYLNMDAAGPDLSAKLLAGDALYIRDFGDGVPDTVEQVLKLMLIYVIYRFYDYAIRLVDDAAKRGILTTEARLSLIEDIIELAPKPRLTERAHGLIHKIVGGVRHVYVITRQRLGIPVPQPLYRVGWMLRRWPNQ